MFETFTSAIDQEVPTFQRFKIDSPDCSHVTQMMWNRFMDRHTHMYWWLADPPLAILLKKMNIFVNFFEKVSSFWQFFWHSIGNFPEGQVKTMVSHVFTISVDALYFILFFVCYQFLISQFIFNWKVFRKVYGYQNFQVLT